MGDHIPRIDTYDLEPAAVAVERAWLDILDRATPAEYHVRAYVPELARALDRLTSRGESG